MDYLNNVRPDLIPADRELHRAAEDHQVPQRRQDDHYSIDDIPKSDPTKESIRDQVLRESQRRQEAKRKQDEAAKAEKEKAEREDLLSHLSPEERAEKVQQDRWRREFEKE